MSKATTQAKKGDSVDEQQEMNVVIWPEWSESEVLAEKWGGKHVYEDPEGMTMLPRSIRKYCEAYKRACDIASDSSSMNVIHLSTLDDLFQSAISSSRPDLSVKEDNRIPMLDVKSDLDTSTSGNSQDEQKIGDSVEPKTDTTKEVIFETTKVMDTEGLHNVTSRLMLQNKHLLESDFMLSLMSALHLFHDTSKVAKVSGSGEEFYPWDNIYPKAKDGLPAYNPSGKYMVKLFWLGAWRKIVIDDRFPVDTNGQPLFVSTGSSHEIWTLILSKALLKIANSRYSTFI
jgi:hypothetical protein